MENSFREEKSIFNLQVDETSKSHLLNAARWAKFVAIVTFIVIGLMVLGGLFGGAAMSSLSSGGLGILGGAGFALLYILFAAIYFYPTYALLKFSTKIKPAILSSDQNQFNSALRYLKNMFKYVGILIIIMFSLYALFLIIIITVGVSGF